MTMKKTTLLTAALCLSASSLAMSLPAYAGDASYSVTNGNELDAHSFEGFKLYRNWCARCHGTYAQGLAGPNLAESLNVISKDEFMNVVAEGKMGSIGSMPAWNSN